MTGIVPVISGMNGRLVDLAICINEEHRLCNESFRYTLSHAMAAGDAALEAKGLSGHGNWMEWHAKNVHHSISTTQRYMTCALNKELLNSANLTNMSIDAALRLAKGGKPMLQSLSHLWYTPREYIDAVHEVMGGIDLDPASNAQANKTVRAKKHYSEKSDGLKERWSGRLFLNPPYGKEGPPFIDKLYEALGSGVDEAIVLVNSRATDADWFQPMFEGTICFTDHRIDFNSPEDKKTSSTHGSCFIYFGPNEEEFARVFSKFGNVVRRWP